MLHRLQTLVENTSPKSIGSKLKRDVELYNWIILQTNYMPLDTALSERAYIIINNLSSNCCSITNKPKRFISITQGYGFCGDTKNCKCIAESISSKVSQSKKSLSIAAKHAINCKRSATNIEKYGVVNTGQTGSAKSAHQAFYSKKENIEKQLVKQQTTIMEKYGVTNISKLDHIQRKKKDTNLEKYGFENPMQSAIVAAKTIQTKKTRYAPHYLAKQNHKRFIQMVRENFELDAIVTEDQYVGVQTRPLISFRCCACGHTFDKRFDYASLPKCEICHPIDISFKSKEELDLLTFVQSHTSCQVISGDRSVISPYEIDIYIPELKLGIEYCGLYWHSELSGKKSWNYHYRKWQAAKDAGVTLITIFSDEWTTQRAIIANTIKIKLGTGNRKTGARNCKPITVMRDTAIEFYNQFHLLGSPTRLPINLGLEYKNELIALMSFIKTTGDNYELTRFASNGMIPGAAGRLLSQFIKAHTPSSIVSFSDNRYSTGNLYKRLGFLQIGTVPPMQQYVENYSIKHHKLSLNKDKLQQMYTDIDLSKTEWQILQELGYDRIWDCGKIKWELQLTIKNM